MAIPTYMATHSNGNMSFGSDFGAEGMAKRLPRNLDSVKQSYMIFEKLPRPARPRRGERTKSLLGHGQRTSGDTRRNPGGSMDDMVMAMDVRQSGKCRIT